MLNLLDTTSDNKDLHRFVTKKWIEVYEQSEKNYSIHKEIIIKTSMLRSNLCYYSNAYIMVKGDILLLIQIMQKGIKQLHLKIMLHLSIVLQKLMA